MTVKTIRTASINCEYHSATKTSETKCHKILEITSTGALISDNEIRTLRCTTC